MEKLRISLGSDKSGYPLRVEIEKHLEELGAEVTVYGPKDEEEAVPFYQVAPLAAKDIQEGKSDLGILICGTGMGMSQVANKFKGIRAACTENEYSAKMCRIINDSNILCMGGWMIAPTLGIKMVDAFLGAEFTVGVEEWRKAWLSNAKAEVMKLEDEIYG